MSDDDDASRTSRTTRRWKRIHDTSDTAVNRSGMQTVIHVAVT